MRIPHTLLRTTWKADWLLELIVALLVLSALSREIILAAVGVAILLILVMFGVRFQRRLGILGKGLVVSQMTSRNACMLGEVVEGKLLIRNESELTANVSSIQGLVQKALLFEAKDSSTKSITPGATAVFLFRIVPLARGRFQLSGYKLTLADVKGLFTGNLTFEQVLNIDTQLGTEAIAKPLTALVLYGGRSGSLYRGPAGSDYSGIREYAPGDEQHRVEWKATARLGRLMVKEFHPETDSTVRIMIDTGTSMLGSSYVGSKLDEAFAIAELLAFSVAQSRSKSIIYIYNNRELVEVIDYPDPSRQSERLKELTTTFQARRQPVEPSPLRPPRISLHKREAPFPVERERLTLFMRSLIPVLRAASRKTGVYRALAEATRSEPEGLTVVLTDLETTMDALVEFAATGTGTRARIVVAQVGAAWRRSDSLESAYLEYQRERRIVRELQKVGVAVLDVRPERLIDALTSEISQTIPA